AFELLAQDLEGKTGIYQSTEDHVPGGAARAVEIRDLQLDVSANLGRELVDLVGLRCGAVPVVDVDHRDAWGTRVEHRQEGRNPTEGGAVPDARRNRDHRAVYETTDDARQGALHPGDGDDCIGLAQEIEVRHEAMEAGYAAVVETLDAVAHGLRRDGR